ncbi:hypothetical protein Y032_0673g1391 [Ancylostoma ceylanicum]|uniref:Uncharacterized protein n=1 Tax=Ancylostoma ceylanicum TaxID=53326 RepID=A0A016WJG5_9BILA|nr:hypothetical protein Y032_0673g1391 [Ancylostoma ceylanicum]
MTEEINDDIVTIICSFTCPGGCLLHQVEHLSNCCFHHEVFQFDSAVLDCTCIVHYRDGTGSHPTNTLRLPAEVSTRTLHRTEENTAGIGKEWDFLKQTKAFPLQNFEDIENAPRKHAQRRST